MNAPVTTKQGAGPVLLGMPHTGTFVPKEIWAKLNPLGKELADTDWHIDALYDDLLEDVTIVKANFHRYVIDANRDPSGQSLYPGQNTTGLVPLTDFEGHAIWDEAPGQSDIEDRIAAFHRPYHQAMAQELERIRNQHGVVILYDCHSIRSKIEFLFNGKLPDFNIGTNDGSSCAAAIAEATHEICTAARRYETVLNGRFKGGWTTRHYGDPTNGIHAIQMELTQSSYLQSERAPWQLDAEKSARIRPTLARILQRLAELAPQMKASK